MMSYEEFCQKLSDDERRQLNEDALDAAMRRAAERSNDFVRNLNKSMKENMATHQDLPYVEEVNADFNAKVRNFANSPAGQSLWGALKTVGYVALFVGTVTIGARLGTRCADAVIPPKH